MELRPKNHRFAGLFKNLMGRQDETDHPQDEKKTKAERADAPELGIPAPDTSQEQLPPVEGDLLAVWEMWNAGEPPPGLALNLSGWRTLPLRAGSLVPERVRVSAKLKQDAGKRLKEAASAERGALPLAAECVLYVSRDRMAAWIFCFPPVGGGADVCAAMIEAALERGQIVEGIEQPAIQYLLENRAYFQLIPIAYGTPVAEGTDGAISECYPRRHVSEHCVDGDGTVDYRAINYVQEIHRGDVICRITPPQPGASGIRVDGSTVEPKKVKEAKIPSGVNTTITDDGTALVATLDGHLEYTGGVFQVKPVLSVPGDVDYSTGNINYPGDVHVHGDVRENFSVIAAGTVTIDGLVEGANIDAGGDLVVAGGVLGNGDSYLKSKGNVRAQYMENCRVFAGKCIYTDCIISSQIYCDDTICVTSGRGTIIGGDLTAAYQVNARIIGSRAGRRTKIRLGEFPCLREELQKNGEALRELRKELSELDKRISLLESHKGEADAGRRLSQSSLRRSVLAMRESKLLKRRAEMEHVHMELSRCRLESGVVYPVTEVFIQQAFQKFEHEKRQCVISYDVETGEMNVI